VSSTLNAKILGFLKCLSVSSPVDDSSSFDSCFLSHFLEAFSFNAGSALLSILQTTSFSAFASISLLSSKALNRTFLFVVKVFNFEQLRRS